MSGNIVATKAINGGVLMTDPTIHLNNDDEQDTEVVQAADWYGALGDNAVVAETRGITADTTDEELGPIAYAEEANIRAGDDDHHKVTVVGIKAYLVELRESLRAEVREELCDAAGTIANATRRRNELIHRLHNWGDSTRKIAWCAGISHTAVQNICKTPLPVESPF